MVGLWYVPNKSIASLKASHLEADWGSKTVGTLVAADHLGRVLSAAGQLEEAEQHLRRALDGLKEAWMVWF